ncbi:hypothetical protein CHS0354_010410 [Potamilus streckersoni]|uniref:Uncharacterized protein n=1 Tax=Potamilus streckersoni TaxID=2493646 RepID=A0AAE0RQQ2_9BIVA|nr:hypothetical protein CHS0354_010410 [Potamilus streckersoni]
MAAGCFFHEDRFQFENLIREIKTCRWIPRPYINRVAMAICSCRKKKRMLDENEVKRALVFLQEIVLMHNTRETILPETLAEFLYSSLNGICNESRKRLLCILFETKNKDFHNLTRETISNIHNLGEKNLKEKDKNMIPPEILARLLTRKKKAMPIEQNICLPMYPRLMKLLHIEINGHFHQFGAKNKCFLELEESKNLDSIDNSIKQTFVRVLCRDFESLQDIINQLLRAARKVQEQADNRREMYLQSLANMADDEDTEPYEKGIFSDDFGKKVAASQRKKKSMCPVPPAGHCLHCLKPFERYKKTSDKACTYHPGFISHAGRWSCCDREAEENIPTQKEHKDRGCCVATHVWKINKKTYRKTHALPELNTCMQDQLLRKVVGCSSKMAIQLLGV